MACEERDPDATEDCSPASTSHKSPKLRKARKDSYRFQRQHGPGDILNAATCPPDCEAINFCCSKPPSAFCYGSSRSLIQRLQAKASGCSARAAEYLLLPRALRCGEMPGGQAPPAQCVMPYLHQHLLWGRGQGKCVGGPLGLLWGSSAHRTLPQEGQTAPPAMENTSKPWKTPQSVLIQTQNSELR